MQLLILGVIAIVIFILEEYLFTASRYFWVGGIVPVLWTVFLAYLVVVNAMNLTVREYALAIIAVIILMFVGVTAISGIKGGSHENPTPSGSSNSTGFTVISRSILGTGHSVLIDRPMLWLSTKWTSGGCCRVDNVQNRGVGS